MEINELDKKRIIFALEQIQQIIIPHIESEDCELIDAYNFAQIVLQYFEEKASD